MDKKLTILGAGVTGITTALVASYCGWQVEVIAENRMTNVKNVSSENYNFSSLYPAASILAHSIAENEKVDDLVKQSYVMFEILGGNKNTGVRQQQHLEIYETEDGVIPAPHYLSQQNNLCSLEDVRNKVNIVQRDKNVPIDGYAFDVWFADMPYYSVWLEQQAVKNGVHFIQQKCTNENIDDITDGSDLVVNCLGAGSASVFPDDLETGFYLEGALVHYPNPQTRPLYDKKSNDFLSWNYTPLLSVYSPAGQRSDVYFYPRSDDFVLGGTRKVGRICKNTGQVDWDDLNTPMVQIDGVELPTSVIEINKELVKRSTGYEISGKPTVQIGRRHLYGTPENPEICLQNRSYNGKLLIDAFGFGGAGVTVSWGVAREVLNIANRACNRDIEICYKSLANFLSD